MTFINRVPVYIDKETSKNNIKNSLSFDYDSIEKFGNQHSPTVVFIYNETPFSESKDCKTLTKIFENLMIKLQNILIINVYGYNHLDFLLFSNEFMFKKVYIFGDDAMMKNLNDKIKKYKITPYNQMQILYLDSLEDITTSKNVKLKEFSWQKIKELHKSTE